MVSLPSNAPKTHMDDGTDDPKQARSELVTLVDNFNQVLSYLTGLLGSDGTKGTARATLEALGTGDDATLNGVLTVANVLRLQNTNYLKGLTAAAAVQDLLGINASDQTLLRAASGFKFQNSSNSDLLTLADAGGLLMAGASGGVPSAGAINATDLLIDGTSVNSLFGSAGGLHKVTVYTSPGGTTWNKHADTVHVRARVWGAGGGGTASGTNDSTSGGSSSFGAFCSATGGTRGRTNPGITPPDGGAGSGGDINIPGQPGMYDYYPHYEKTSGNFKSGGRGGDAPMGAGIGGLGYRMAGSGNYGYDAIGYGAGGGAGQAALAGGGAGGYAEEFIADIATSSLTVTVGAAGSGGTGTYPGGDGGGGLVIVEEYKG